MITPFFPQRRSLLHEEVAEVFFSWSIFVSTAVFVRYTDFLLFYFLVICRDFVIDNFGDIQRI